MAQDVNIESADRPAVRDALRSVSRTNGARLDGICILLVEDDAIQSELLTLFFERVGAAVMQAGSVPAALESIERRLPDVVLSDISMPGEDGFGLIRQVRSSPRGEVRSLPVVAVTALATTQDRKRTLEAGFDRHVSKPAVPTELVTLVRTLARGSPATRAWA